MQRIAIALGGNAFAGPGRQLTMASQLEFAHGAPLQLLCLLGRGTQLLISHGNICVVDALRPGQETTYYPDETNLHVADLVVINKVRHVDAGILADIRRRIATVRPAAAVIESDLEVTVDDPALISGKRVLVVEDGPTLTHGDMSFGAGTIAAQNFAARELVDPRPAAVGTIAEVYRQFPHLKSVLPALGYSDQQ